ncbi:MAG: hypothetical protein J6R82_06300 [Clostridia bacterium]|nr:hypothetical protein [Clostridia bacterium]
MKSNKVSILRGMGYSFAQSVISWIVFFLIVYLPIWNSSLPLYIVFAIWFLAIPFYFMGKKNCNALYLLFALIMNPIIAYVMLWSIGILIMLFPDLDVSFELFLPIFGIPMVGTLPIAIDVLLYFFKWIRKLLGKRKSI